MNNDALILTVPKAGLLTMLDYIDSGIDIKFSYVGLGNGRQKSDADTLILGNLITKLPITSGIVDKQNLSLSITAMGQASINHEVNEIGLFSDKDELIAVISKPDGYYFKTDLNNFFVMSFAVALQQELAENIDKIKLSFAPNEQLTQALLSLHLKHKNPHPFYYDYAEKLINAHLSAANPHNMYAMKNNVVSVMQNFIKRLDALYRIFSYLIPSTPINPSNPEAPLSMQEFGVGTHTISIPAGTTIEVHLVGAGGSGAGSLWASNISGNWLKMKSGGDSSFSINDKAVIVDLIAGGGEGGTRGVWNNGSAYLQGVAGIGGQFNIETISAASRVEFLAQKDGQMAYLETAHDWSNRDTRGGVSQYRGGTGGEGGYTVETRKHRCYGGGGGSGAYLHFRYTNTTSALQKATIVVGDKAAPDTISPELNNGKSGEVGFASVEYKG